MAQHSDQQADVFEDLECRLERGEVVFFPSCPFSLPPGAEHQFLLAQELGRGHKNISFAPGSGRVRGYRDGTQAHIDRLRGLLAEFSRTVTHWLAQTLPRYCSSWRPDQVSYRPAEEAGRVARLKARNDLLHVDAFPNRPTNGWRILRVFANINPTEPRVWITGAPFATLLERYGDAVGLPAGVSWTSRLRSATLSIFRPDAEPRSTYDEFMLRMHDYLKASDEFQNHPERQQWSFPPGSAWLAMTDTCSHAVLRGRFALEHSYFIAPRSLALPDESPAALLEKRYNRPVLRHAA
jgi:3-deoxy-D-manno-oct-2-ulosonic acid (Kdo) hydroxylase